jgi:hypothetical protein
MDSEEALLIEKAVGILERGFTAYNLRSLGGVLAALTLKSKWPTACFVLGQVVTAISSQWDVRAVPSTEADWLRTTFQPLFSRILHVMATGDRCHEMVSALDALVLAFVTSPTPAQG